MIRKRGFYGLARDSMRQMGCRWFSWFGWFGWFGLFVAVGCAADAPAVGFCVFTRGLGGRVGDAGDDVAFVSGK